MNEQQTLVLNRVLDGMEAKLTNVKWAATRAIASARPIRTQRVSELRRKSIYLSE